MWVGKRGSPLVVGGQVAIIQVRVIGAPDIAGVVKAELCGLLHQRDREGTSQVRRGWGFGVGAGYPRPYLFPHGLLAKQGNICLLHPLRGLELPVVHAAGFWAGRGHLQGTESQEGWPGGQGEAAGWREGRQRPMQPQPPQPQDASPSSPTEVTALNTPLTFQPLGLSPSTQRSFLPPPRGPSSASPNILILPILHCPDRMPPGPRNLPVSSSLSVPFSEHTGEPPKATHSGVQSPLLHSAEAGLPLGASGQHRQELIPLRQESSPWHGFRHHPNCPTGGPQAVAQTFPSSPGSAYVRMGHGEKV